MTRSLTVSHIPDWRRADLPVDALGATRPGWVCIHELENGNGQCDGSVFDLADADHYHSCVVTTGLTPADRFWLTIYGIKRAPWLLVGDPEWDENWKVWPHCNNQGGPKGACWMHVTVGSPCRCSCRWCRIARRFRPGLPNNAGEAAR